ncbi:disease resistance protein At4g27190-like, partial [Juglans microcarpa x Juglans regia]|uniref:disease resistance protein At4g27190-like n=1 Tax=Juglans microcarpa x Juglans regia TaxID=2249226 RepID=UPI001B7F248F
MENIPISIAAKIAEYTVAPVGQWLCYSCHYSKNMENLKKQQEKLQDAKDRCQQSVHDALRKGEKIHSDVNKWLIEVYAITESATRILGEGEEKAEARSSHATCLNLKQRHRLSREANKIARNIVKHLENGKFNTVSYLPAAQDHMVTTRVKNYVALESRTSVVNGIMEALGDANISKIGVWGMPGVGKSTLMKEIERRAKEEKLFHGVVLAAVTESPELSRIRGEIAVMLNQALHRQQTEIERANLQQESSTKDAKLLVILDDIWKQIELEDIGIPSEGCKVVLTSRNRDVLVREMGTKNHFELKSLGEEEAWNLFEKMAGDFGKDPGVREVAIKVAKECAGLPVALTTVSKALKGKSLSTWKDAELRLKRPPPVDVPEILSPIYSCIELSYNHLADKELKSLFLLCPLVGELYIDYKNLLKYGFGLGLFRDIVTLEEARHRLDSLVSNLQDSCLLLESSKSSRRFYMHDVVRYVATIIGSKDCNMLAMRDNGGLKAWPDVDSLKTCRMFSILGGDIDQLPSEMKCPELRLFLVNLEDRSLQIRDTFFQGMDKLKVLDLTKTPLPSLPSSLLLLRNLQTLCLYQCVLGDISGIGELKNLLTLTLCHSDISTLPREIGSLVRLRLLDLSNCSKLEMIPPNVISSLVKLGELYMTNSFVQWEAEGPNDERKNASLAELKHLSNLTNLEIQIPDDNNLPKDLVFKKLERYTICIGDVWDRIDSAQSSRTLKLKLNSSFQSEFWIKMLLKRTENLHLDKMNGVKSVIPEIDEEGFQQVMHLQIQNNDEIKHILNLRTPVIAFPTLETFVLENMISLEGICHGKLCLTAFKNLRVLKVIRCDKLRYVFSSSIARGLPLLEELNVRRCNTMGAIVVKEEEDGDMILFHQLHTLVLKDLPKLVSFLSTKNSFMTDCGEIIIEGNDNIQMPLLHHQVAFPRLEKLILGGLPKIKHVWSEYPKTVFNYLEQLKILNIVVCGVEEIVPDEGG